MAFDVKDFFMAYSKRGDARSVFNVARSDDDNEGLKFYAYWNDEGAYLIQKVSTSGTLKIYGYYATRQTNTFDASWTGRAALTYREYYELFNQS
jgi:hypothetical protein